MATRSSPITVGRDDELARIDDARSAAAAGRPAIVVVRGEAGIGKTRLVGDAVERARAAGSAILHGACLNLEGEGLPYLPLVEALRKLVRSTPPDRVVEILGPARADLGQLVPEIAALDGAAEDAPGREGTESSVDRARLFERLLGVLGRLGADVPLLAVVEDVQWIDPATRDLITFLVHNVTTEQLVAIITFRTDELPAGHPILAWLAEISRAPGAMRVDLGRLSREDLQRQLAAMGDRPVPASLVQSIWQRSEGHPLFAEELFAAAAEPASFAPPPSLVDVLLARVARLTPEALAVVRALAVAGRPVDERLIGPIVDRSAVEVGASFREAASLGVLNGLPDGRHAFRHELLREIVERDLSMAERREIHAGLARLLEASPELADDRPAAATAELARHWAGADRPIEAHRAAVAAAREAEVVHAFGDAHRQFERAIALEERLPADARPSIEERIAIRRRAATAADLVGAPERAAELIRDAMLEADSLGDPQISGVLHARLAFLIWAAGDSEGALAEHRRAVDLVPAEPPSMERAAVLAGLGGALMGLGRWAESRPLCEAAIDCAIRCGATPEESRARTMLGSDLVSVGEVDAGLDELRAAHRLAGGERSELWVVTGHNLALNLLATDHLDESLEVAAATLDGAREGGLERRYGMELAALVGDILWRLGRWDDAERVTALGLSFDQRDEGTPYLAAVRARVVGRRGAIAEARRRLDSIDSARLEPDLAEFHAIVAAETHLLEGRPDLALDMALDSIRTVASSDVLWGVPIAALGLRAAAELAAALRATRDEAGLAALLASAQALRDHALALTDRVITTTGRAWLATGAAETARLDDVVDPEPWRRAVEAWDSAFEPIEGAYARYRFAETALRRSGVKADVASELIAAWRTATALGAIALGEAIEVLARRARIPLVVTAPEQPEAAAAIAEPVATGGRSRQPSHGLSAREIEVLRLVAAGRSNGEIGDELFITRKTAGVHVTHILDKLGVSNRVEAAMAAARLGLLEPAAADESEATSRVG